jgi:heme/copper-type cytochrome/quinol oxidase subunit 3
MLEDKDDLKVSIQNIILSVSSTEIQCAMNNMSATQSKPLPAYLVLLIPCMFNIMLQI